MSNAFTWRACAISRGAADIGAWPIVCELEDAVAPSPARRGFRFPWRNPGWPSVLVPGVGPGLVGNVWLIVEIDGQWCAATFEWLRFPEQGEEDEAPLSERDDQIRDGRWLTWDPAEGELVGLMVSCPARDSTRTREERSAIAWTRLGQPGILSHEGRPPEPDPKPDPEPDPQPQPQPEPEPDPEPTPEPDWAAALAPLLVVVEQIHAEVQGQTATLRVALEDIKKELARGLKIRF